MIQQPSQQVFGRCLLEISPDASQLSCAGSLKFPSLLKGTVSAQCLCLSELGHRTSLTNLPSSPTCLSAPFPEHSAQHHPWSTGSEDAGGPWGYSFPSPALMTCTWSSSNWAVTGSGGLPGSGHVTVWLVAERLSVPRPCTPSALVSFTFMEYDRVPPSGSCCPQSQLIHFLSAAHRP